MRIFPLCFLSSRTTSRATAAAYHAHRCFASTSTSVDESDCRHFPIRVLDHMDGADWDNRIALQAKWTNEEKGWQVGVEWKHTPFGVGLFATDDIAEGTILRIGQNGHNLMQFQSIQDIEEFCRHPEDYPARLRYVSDYLWGFSWQNTDAQGYDLPDDTSSVEDRFMGMWVPGNGLNHNLVPNTVYRTRKGGTQEGIVLVALCDVAAGDELFDDYRRHGRAPEWLKEFAREKQVSLNFAECNDFVVDPSS
ncbi:expressed unknown protein [Seminavis robusta]|uniref:SET domain-containing protein n=1 Tax=Seminavis robusta TaxID=568900 RepID=A0A9N8HQ12_9STRA|nr:expressed unknown protein [Seminavis robusta]|eukprot:Sro944_g222960.1 n/a (250) ;mRNA; r:21199-21948